MKNINNIPRKNNFEIFVLILRNTLRYRIARSIKNNLNNNQKEILEDYFLGTMSVNSIIKYFLSRNKNKELDSLIKVYKKLFGEKYKYIEGDENLRS